MPWNEIQPERVSDREIVSFRFKAVGDAIAEAWTRALSTHTDVHLGVGSMIGDVKECPQWWNSAWLTQGTSKYEGGGATELVATGPIGPRSYRFEEPDAPVWVMLDFQWTPAGSFVGLTEDPPWTENLLDPTFRLNSPPVTVPQPEAHDPVTIGIQRVWLRENHQELWCSGTYGWGWHLRSLAVEESDEDVRLTCRIGRTDEYLSAAERAINTGVTMAIPAIACRWAICSSLAAPLGDRRVYFRTSDRQSSR